MIELSVKNCYASGLYYKMFDEVRKVDKNLLPYIVPLGPFLRGMTDIWLEKGYNELSYSVSFSFCGFAEYTIKGICSVQIWYDKYRYRGYVKIEKA